ncbi:MAG: clostripain-related cysteine peptidase [Bacilli bacterium]
MNNVYQNTMNNSPNYGNVNSTNKKPNLKIILYILIGVLTLLIGLIVVFSFSKRDFSTRTFMIYMVGSDLESRGSMGTYELEGIDPKSVDLENVNVVLIAGGTSKWGNDYIAEDETSIYQLTNNGFVKVKQQSIKNMGDSSTLSNFINFVTEHYITDEYELLFWNHGGAIMGSEYDELSDYDNLSLEEISRALSNSSFNEKNKIETIIFSTCLNGTIENANVFKDYANYFVASEEISMSIKYKSDFSFINEVTPETKSLDIGKLFISKYKEKMTYLKNAYKIQNEEYNIYSTYSIVDLSNLDNLNDAIDNFFEKLDVASNYNIIAKVRSNLYQYAYKLAGEPSYDTVDLYNLISNLKQLSPKEAEKVLTELENTVIYNYATDSSSRGISIYFPYNGSSSVQNMFLKMYDNISDIDNYNNFISEFSSLRTTNSSKRLSFKDNESTVNIEDTEADFELELTEEQVQNYARAQYLVFRDNKDGTYLPIYKGTEVTLEDNKLKAKIKDRELKIRSKSDGLENILTLFEEEVGDTYIKYSTIVTLENLSSSNFADWKMETATISLLLDKKTNKVNISGILLSATDDLPGRTMVDLNDYTQVIFASSSYNIANADGTYNENWESNGIIEGIEVDVGDFEFDLQDYNDDYDYYSVFRIFDVNNNSYYSKLVKMK